jgi:hypothetical protein
MSDSVLYIVFAVILLPFAVAALKGYVWKSLVGILVLVFLGPILSRIPIVGLVLFIPIGLAIYRSLSWATPGSLWSSLFYDEHKRAAAERHHTEDAESPSIDSSETTDQRTDSNVGNGSALSLGASAPESDPAGAAMVVSISSDPPVGSRDDESSEETDPEAGEDSTEEAPPPSPGWYQSPFEPWRKQYWDGTSWGELEQVVCSKCGRPLTAAECNECHR